MYSFLPNQPPKTQNFAQTQNTTICNDPFNPNSKKLIPFPKKEKKKEKKNKKNKKQTNKQKTNKQTQTQTQSEMTRNQNPFQNYFHGRSLWHKEKKIINYLLI